MNPWDLPSIAECGCGRVYWAVHWARLSLDGIIRPGDGQEPEAIEMRRCRCGSTIGAVRQVH